MGYPLHFNKLSLDNKYDFISEHGKYIGVRSYYNHAINLYLVEDTFYELLYFSSDNNIVKIEPLDDMKKIGLYIKHMNELNTSKPTRNIYDKFNYIDVDVID